MINFILNCLWLILGGWTAATSWFIVAVFMALSIIGIPWARASFNIALLTLWPFGANSARRKKPDLGTSPAGSLGNILWFIFAGWWLAFLHLIWSFAFGLTIIGIPFALQHLKLARLSIAPIGKEIQF